jgi:UDP-N-acetylmuramate dehydrogenase
MKSIKKDVSLSDKTSYKIGGPARYYVSVQTEEDIRKALQWTSGNNQPVFILGKGTNILISDSGWHGLVIDLSGFTSITWDDAHVKCHCGLLLHTLVKESVDRGFTGMERLAGIPGSVGGALVMNAGAFEQNISDCLDIVKGIDCSNTTLWSRENREIDFGYRTSSLKKMNSVIVSASFTFKHRDPEKAETVYKEILKERTSKQPLDMLSCGSVFKRPEGMFAGELIEKCGLKGHTIGGAMVSAKHANFIVNTSNATASDARRLIAFVQERVFKKYKVLLEPEVVFVGEFDVPLYKP